ncbi:DUF6791 domain-containing protein [Altererythrobacter sp.]|uniref:DUF6791 domain-containing protein n=1 Tax=Altererythrobacter sp. TaxID=1872480 RepID=UPI003D083CA8
MSLQLACPDGSFEALEQAGVKFGVADNRIIIPVPFLGEDGEAHRGYLVDPLHIMGDGSVGLPSNHQMYFAGGTPHELDGRTMLPVLGEGAGNNYPVFGGAVAQYYFSYKIRANGHNREYVSLAEKVVHYFRTISAPVEHKFPGTVKAMVDVDIESDYDPPFKFPDAHSAAAGLDNYNIPLKELTVGLIGVGGTGSYILDFLVKTPVRKIRVFDADDFEVKTSFRSPGSSNVTEFDRPKVEVYRDRYGTFREGLEFHSVRINSSNVEMVSDCDFIFLAIDNGISRRELTSLFDSRELTYIDVGMGLERADDGLFGMVRTTFVSDETRQVVQQQNAIPFADADQEQYLTNIQIAEWIALTAAIAVIRFKSHFGFYADDVGFFRHIIPSRRMSAITSKIPS